MNRQEKEFFDALTKNREWLASALEEPALSGVRHSVVEKYSDQAHFIYELLQNADDALATNARFVLEKDRLIFAHDGKRHFSITDPDKEKEDSISNSLGDINAITSIANSNKTGASIGKFGVGFKAVFQYTTTPLVYDPVFRFKIDRFIVPTELNEDYPGRKPEETLFVFPFNHSERNASEAYSDISLKLKRLSYSLLFLSNLKSIVFEYEDVLGLYGKKVQETKTFGDTKAEYIILSHNVGEELVDESLWLFSRKYDRGEEYPEKERYLTYSTGFFLNDEGHLIPVNKPAFCFFPTKEITGLKFIVHAPFLLTDSREGIRAGVQHNDNMINALAELAADALVYLKEIGKEKEVRLIDDDIVTIIPTSEGAFSNPSDRNQISFFPFYADIKIKMRSAELLPTKDGYVGTNNAYWAASTQLPQIFSDDQLSGIVDNPRACWVFPSLARTDIQKNIELYTYIDSLVKTYITEEAVLCGRTREFYIRDGVRKELEPVKGITSEYIESQSAEWLHTFYRWISESKTRTKQILRRPIFWDQTGKASAAFDNKDQPILFLPVENMTEYKVINQELLHNEETKRFIEQIGIKEPSLKDQIYTVILPTYENDAKIDTTPHFKRFLEYYSHCSRDEEEEFIRLIKDVELLRYHTVSDTQVYRGKACSMYLPKDELLTFYATRPQTRFINLDEYKALVGSEQEEYMMRFLKALGVKQEISISKVKLTYEQVVSRKDLPRPRSTYEITYEEYIIDGCKENLRYIIEKNDTERSYKMWKALLKVIEVNCSSWQNLSALLRGTCNYYFRSSKKEFFDSSDLLALRKWAWIVNSENKLVSPEEVTIESLSKEYDLESLTAKGLLGVLGIKEGKEQTDINLTDEQREKIAFVDKLKEYGIENYNDLEEFKKFREFKQKKDARRHSTSGVKSSANNEAGLTNEEELDDYFENEYSDDDESTINRTTVNVIRDIAQRSRTRTSNSVRSGEIEEESDEDEYTHSTVDYNKKIERAKEKSVTEIEKIVHYAELQDKAVAATRYSFVWFKTLLEMECINSGENNANSKEVSISFARVERENGTQRTLVLKQPNMYIPHFMEDLADIPMVLHMGEKTKTVAIEVASIKSYSLRVKMKNAADIDGIDLESVSSVSIDAKSPVFLLDELKKQFAELDFEDDYNLQENLKENIDFVFGPPGTGKTTHLANNVLIPMMKENKECKVLVLTPTNKSADVLVRRIMEVSGDDKAYEKWLVRFGTTGDEEIEKSEVYKDKTFDIRTLEKNVTVTTIARFPYDFFMPQGARVFLNGINWDYIVIDEASMIPIANIVYPLYKKTTKKFIIAGDPFQIEPITSVDLWKNENIYTMVKLDSFVEPKTIPHQYKVDLLTTQYRSVPDIGNVFSEFAYGGILKHYRSSESQKSLNLGKNFDIDTLNIIKFPVSKYESIFRCKRLQHSSCYQVYSALFTFEYVCFLGRALYQNNPGVEFKIGVIAPYRAQADMIDKLIASEKLPKEIDVQVGTIHGFQGDECDIIFAVFNPPPFISASKDMFLNKKNIINVSISRARDYLFIVMPDDNTENVSNLRLVKKVETLIQNGEAWNEFWSPDLEYEMFGDYKYLENKTFSTSHQSVNVYGVPESCYEVRTEDTAVDVQIHKKTV